ncbi:ubiquitin carboxyl-terminal hydrolase 4 [Folsomia candida]|uniref:ubiquitin carboxyl-terminal hydrolase 4 n=1 Tax=Folsomia candida TaxID=158441 RepID=UPI000B8F19EF|nr:ubiquitin carboxyl-terminal hydrolase 4 [Folsomia candida]
MDRRTKFPIPKPPELQCKFVPATVGLPNEENTGWLNIIVQCLCNAEPFVKYFLANGHQTDLRKKYGINMEKEGRVVNGLAQLFQNMWNPSTPGTLRDMKNKFKKIIGQVYPQWKGDDLQDAFEFLVILLDTLSEELDLRATKPTQYRHALFSKDKSEQQLEAEMIAGYLNRFKTIVQDNFIGFIRTSVTCSRCNKDTLTFDPSMTLWLPFPMPNENSGDAVTLADCFDCYTAPEKISGSYFCVHCQKEFGVVKQTKLWLTPQIWVICLNRFGTRGVPTLGKRVDYPIEGLDLSPWVKSPRNEGNIYDLFGVVTYSSFDGSLNRGYYAAYCKNPVDHAWRKFSDERVEIVNLDVAYSKEKIQEEAYVLFYTRRGHAN